MNLIRSLLKSRLTPAITQKLRARLPAFMHRNASYAQCGEDVLVSFVLDLLYGKRPKTYLDIGAHHPFHLSNTALLYAKGGNGILVEPDPHLAKRLRQARPRDRILQNGVHFSVASHADFFVFDVPTLNTFSAQEMQRYQTMGYQLLDTLSIELKNINELLAMSESIDFMSLDIEGLDQTVLTMIDWSRYRPSCLCVETVHYETDREPRKISAIIDWMQAQDYLLYADTFINSIFIDQHQWHRHWQKKS